MMERNPRYAAIHVFMIAMSALVATASSLVVGAWTRGAHEATVEAAMQNNERRVSELESWRKTAADDISTMKADIRNIRETCQRIEQHLEIRR